MMMLWSDLNQRERETYSAITAFLEERLEERDTVNWALEIHSQYNSIKRLAIIDILNGPRGKKLNEPWLTAWRLIEESWSSKNITNDHTINVYAIRDRLNSRDLSGSLISMITDLVAPTLCVKMFGKIDLQYRKIQKHPKLPSDLFSTSLTSGKVLDQTVLGLKNIVDIEFLVELAYALDAAVRSGLSIARRIGWDGKHRLWKLGDLYRVNYYSVERMSNREGDIDRHHTGIAPSVKLLHAVISRLAQINLEAAVEFVHSWKQTTSPIHLRLWASFSCNAQIGSADEVGILLLSLDDLHFWDIYNFPEIAELRALRYSEFMPDIKQKITARIRKGPPRNQWPKKQDLNSVKEQRLYNALRELKRIQTAGGALSIKNKKWIDSKITTFKDLVDMDQIDHGFKRGATSYSRGPTPDNRYNAMSGADRLKAIESALSKRTGGWEDDPAERAGDWIRNDGNQEKILTDFEAAADNVTAYPKIWERFGWAHSPIKCGAQGKDLIDEASRVIILLKLLSKESIKEAIEGMSFWLSSWDNYIVNKSDLLEVWIRMWPIAVHATNARKATDEEIDLHVIDDPSDAERQNIDTLNTPAGRLIGVFLTSLTLIKVEHPFSTNGAPLTMRNAIIGATGYSGLIAKVRMIEALHYFIKADHEWSQEHLIVPLSETTREALALWETIAMRTQFKDVLEIIGYQMADRATDLSLDRQTRKALVFSIVIELLTALSEERKPVISKIRVQQMLRSLDDEIRSYGANAIQRFVQDVSKPVSKDPAALTPEKLFQKCAIPFLQEIWPQEKTLVTPGVSKALVDLPITAKGIYTKAVEVIERFLVPFDSWSLNDYGIHRSDNDSLQMTFIDNPNKAASFLKLLDMTISTDADTIYPHNLSDALEQVRNSAPKLVDSTTFRRLETLARRR